MHSEDQSINFLIFPFKRIVRKHLLFSSIIICLPKSFLFLKITRIFCVVIHSFILYFYYISYLYIIFDKFASTYSFSLKNNNVRFLAILVDTIVSNVFHINSVTGLLMNPRILLYFSCIYFLFILQVAKTTNLVSSLKPNCQLNI